MDEGRSLPLSAFSLSTQLLTFVYHTRHYAPFDHNPPLLFAKICCGGICISNLCSSWPYMENLQEERKTLWLWRTRGRLELTIPPYIESSNLLASDTPTKWLAARWHCVFWVHTYTLCAFIDLCPAELSHYELHRKPHETVTHNFAIAVSLACSTARKGGLETRLINYKPPYL